MSRVFDALQKSQGQNPSALPLSPTQPEGAPADAPSFVAAAAATDVLSFAPLETPAAVATAVPADASWLNVPPDRVLTPHPTPEQRLISITEPGSPGAEMFRVLATRLAHMRNKRRLHKLLITSSVGEEGKSVIAVNLAFALCRRSNERVLLVEADLRRPTARTLLAPSPLPGICDWSEGKLALENSLYRVGDLPFWFLSAGKGMAEPMPLLESVRFAQMLETVSAAFDWVLLDATPMLPMADSTSLSRLCDGVLVVVRENHTRLKILNKALGSIEQNKLVGMVLNGASLLNVGYDRYYGNKNGKSKKELKKELKEQAKKAKAATA
jgi:capsular exopolysaccharide synthesis family protein